MDALLSENPGCEGSNLFPLLEDRTCSFSNVLKGVYCIDMKKPLSVFIKETPWMKELRVAPITRGPWKPKYFVLYYCIPGKPTWIAIPRYFGLSKLGNSTHDERKDGEAINVQLTTERELRPIQTQAVEAALDVIERWGGTTIVADCGSGKSGIGAALICSIQKKTLWITPRTVLMHQAKSDLQTWIPRIKIGWLQGKWNATKRRRDTTIQHHDSCPDDVDNCDIIIASIESLSQCEYPDELLHSFGCVIVDEMHVLAAKTLVHVLPKLPSKITIGLTATPDRKDGLEKVLYWLVGPTSFVFKRLPSITGLRNTVHIQHIKLQSTISPVMNEQGIDFTTTTQLLAKDTARNTILHQCILSLLQQRKKVLVVTTFVDHGNYLYSLPIDVEKYFLYSKSDPADVVKSKSSSCRLLIATYGFISVGYDDEDIDAMILALPRSSIQQTIGRIERTKEGKLVPIVIDIIDSLSIYQGMANARRKFYCSRGFSITSNNASNSSSGDLSFLTNKEGGIDAAPASC